MKELYNQYDASNDDSELSSKTSEFPKAGDPAEESPRNQREARRKCRVGTAGLDGFGQVLKKIAAQPIGDIAFRAMLDSVQVFLLEVTPAGLHRDLVGASEGE